MSGDRWLNAQNGAKKYIQHLLDNHFNPKLINLVIIFFDDDARIIFNKTLDKPIGNIWKMRGGGTNFE